MRRGVDDNASNTLSIPATVSKGGFQQQKKDENKVIHLLPNYMMRSMLGEIGGGHGTPSSDKGLLQQRLPRM
jgi:hypothetical protein